MNHNPENHIILIRLLAICILLGTQAASAKTVCVNSAGGSCQPTLAAGIATATAGDTVTLAPGIYYEEAVLIDKPLTLKGSAKAIVDAGKIPDPADTSPPVALIHGSEHALIIAASNVTIEGISIRNARSNGIELKDGPDRVSISNVGIFNIGGYCINSNYGSAHVTVVGSTLQSCKDNAINLINSAYAVIVKNRLNHTLSGIHVVGHTATVQQNQIGASTYVAIQINGNDALIQNNAINAVARDGIEVYGDNPQVIGNTVTAVSWSGVYFACPNNCSRARITKNKIAGSSGSNDAIQAIASASGLLIESNSVSGVVGNGVYVQGNAEVVKNKIANAGDDGHSCFYLTRGSHSVRSNQLLDCGAAGIEAYGHNTTIIGNTVNRAGTTGIFAAADNIRVENNKISNSSGFGVITGYDNNSIFLTHNQLKDNRDAICDAASGTTISGNSGNGKVWDVGSSFGTQGVDGCEFLFN